MFLRQVWLLFLLYFLLDLVLFKTKEIFHTYTHTYTHPNGGWPEDWSGSCRNCNEVSDSFPEQVLCYNSNLLCLLTKSKRRLRKSDDLCQVFKLQWLWNLRFAVWIRRCQIPAGLHLHIWETEALNCLTSMRKTTVMALPQPPLI